MKNSKNRLEDHIIVVVLESTGSKTDEFTCRGNSLAQNREAATRKKVKL